MKDTTYADLCDRVRLVAKCLFERIGDDVKVNEAAQIGTLSPYHFQRVFSRISGETFGEMTRRLALERAAYQLQNSKKSITDIAFDAGYSSVESFARAFKGVFGSSATEFRDMEWSSHHLLAANGVHYNPEGRFEFEPVARRGDGLAYEIVEVEPFTVLYDRHPGAPHLIVKSHREFLKQIVNYGFEVANHPSITFADEIRLGMSALDIVSYVAVEEQYVANAPYPRREIAGGSYLKVHGETEGKGGDLWMRIWLEALPDSGYAQVSSACFQRIFLAYDPIRPKRVRYEIYVPVKPKRARTVAEK